jgi:hypothetical protein
VPPSSQLNERLSDRLAGEPLAWWVRFVLVVMALALIAVFVTATRIDPYNADGSAQAMATHRQLGLPPCTFQEVTGMPCPSCGMTTSFALLMRGDVANSARANWVGTVLATFCLLVIPWAAASVLLGRALFIRSLERALMAVIMTLLVLMFVRWFAVIGLMWWQGKLFRL